MSLFFRSLAAVLMGVSAISTAIPDSLSQDSLSKGFANPPNSARPRVWWHWMNGNVTQDGIAKDLDWMQRIGVGGLQSFDVNLSTPQVVEKRLAYMTSEWKDAFRFATQLAEQKGLELAVASSPGWSETGGPWVKPEDAIKKLVWSETTLTGGKRLSVKLPPPPKATGPFQDVPVHDDLPGMSEGEEIKAPEYYSDVAVLAYRVRKTTSGSSIPHMASRAGKLIDAAVLTDGSFATGTTVARGTTNEPQLITIEFDAPRTIRSITIFLPGAVSVLSRETLAPRLEASEDGGNWRKLVDIPLSTVPTTVSFSPVTAKKFRVVMQTGNAKAPLDMNVAPGVDLSYVQSRMFVRTAKLKIAELCLSSEAKINQFETKAGFSISNDYYSFDSEIDDDLRNIAPEGVVDLTARMQADGTLNWLPPKGSWRVVRLGWSLTGKVNHPATEESTGLEVDKMDEEAVQRYLNQYLQMYQDTVGANLMGEKGVRALVTDSTQVGAFNWTPKMIEQFKRLRGYDPTPWLPTLTGEIIGSRRKSDAFLYDFRTTIAQLHASAHYATIAKIAHQHGLKIYGEAFEAGRPALGDDIAMRRFADYPMAALWTFAPTQGARIVLRADLKGASSTAHVFGQNIAAAESMTSMLSPWADAPADLRRIIDFEFASGINLPVIHTSVHQPVDDKLPGLSLMMFGQYFNRHESWAEMARPWVDYIARNSFMLQQGKNVADVAYFYGEEAPLTGLYWERLVTDAPTQYAYDFVNKDALFDALTAEGSDLVTQSGARYKLLYLGGSSYHMTLAVLQRIAQLVEAGATVVGIAPESSPSLKDDPVAFATLVKRLWNGQSITQIGKGKVIADKKVEAALASTGVAPDFTFTKTADDSEILFVHRRLDDGDVYFVNNRKNRAESIEAKFRVSGKQPEIWRADSGTSELVSYRIDNGETVISLKMAAEDSFFVVFRKTTSLPSVTIAQPTLNVVGQFDGPWEVAFQSNRGAPPSVHLEKLASLSEQPDLGVKYFSGVATYTKSFTLPEGVTSSHKLLLDLGKIGDVAEVRVNGQLVGTVWHVPYQLDIAKAAKSGVNTLDVRVANLWVNRLIGDAQPGANKFTWTAQPTYKAAAPLRPSGLIGPVRLFAEGH